MSIRLGEISPDKFSTAGLSDEDLRQLQRSAQAHLSRLAEVRRASGGRVRMIGAGWTGAQLLSLLARLEEALQADADIVVRFEDDGTLVFADGRKGEGLEPDRVRALFSQAKMLRFDGAVRERVGQAIAPGGAPLHEWWGRGYGSPSLRRFLVPWAATEAAEEDVDSYEHGSMYADLDGIAIMIQAEDVDPDPDPARWALIDAMGSPAGFYRTFEAEDEENARAEAIAAVSKDREEIILATYLGTSTDERLEGVAVYRSVASFCLRRQARAAASLLDRAMESRKRTEVGRILRVREADDGSMEWDVQVVMAGMSLNDDAFYPRDVLESEIVRVFEGAPVEELFLDPHQLAHLPNEALQSRPDGITGIVVGQLRDLRFDGTEGGRAPSERVAELIARDLNMTAGDVIQQSVGRVLATLSFDDNARGRDAHGMVASADNRGQLADHPQLSIDANEAEGPWVFDPDTKTGIRYIKGFSDKYRRTISMVNKGAMGGLFLGRKAA